ncbi:hypothetical protein [Nocardia suismassiliense]|uniref:hypothetical protein n=1 Tax=Nocardia suismassiliense TaxID=2077092 RepID=UPI00131EF0DC|nr:hypothetical protein [Nocardia suismassiliense]
MDNRPSPLGMATETIRRARLTVAQHATDRADAAELLKMLGLISEPPTQQQPKLQPVRNPGSCVKCGVTTGDPRAAGHGGARYGGRGRCDACYQRLVRAERKAAQGDRTPQRRVIERSR